MDINAVAAKIANTTELIKVYDLDCMYNMDKLGLFHKRLSNYGCISVTDCKLGITVQISLLLQNCSGAPITEKRLVEYLFCSN